jgi:hypothetical protein
MTWRRAALYWFCFLMLGIYYLRFERPPATQVGARMPRAAFLTIGEDQIQSIEARRGDEVVRCHRVGGRWHVLEPSDRTVPSDLVSSLISTVSHLPDVEVVAEQPPDLAPFGLDVPAAQLILTPAAGEPVTIRLGNRNPSGTAVYAQRSSSLGVFLVGVNARYYADLLFEGVRRGGERGGMPAGAPGLTNSDGQVLN